MRIDAAIVDDVPLGVDTPEDLARARELLAALAARAIRAACAPSTPVIARLERAIHAHDDALPHRRRPTNRHPSHPLIPAKAGIQGYPEGPPRLPPPRRLLLNPPQPSREPEAP